MAARRPLRRRDGVGRGRVRLRPPDDGRSPPAISGESSADERRAGSGRARARGGDSRHDCRTWRCCGTNATRTARLHGTRIWRVGHLLLRLAQGHIGLADIAARLGRPVPAAFAVVGTHHCACGHRAAADRVGNTRQRVVRSITGYRGGLASLAHCRYRCSARPLRIYGGLAARRAARPAGGESGRAEDIQLVTVPGGARAYDSAGGVVDLEYASVPYKRQVRIATVLVIITPVACSLTVRA